jgi:hypothetical protein
MSCWRKVIDFPALEGFPPRHGARTTPGATLSCAFQRIPEPGFGKIAVMEKPLRAEELFPLVDRLSAHERFRLLRLISLRPAADDRDAYLALPPRHDEFSSDTDPLAWDSDGWEGIG